MKVRLLHPVAPAARHGRTAILGIRGRWEDDVIHLEEAIDPEVEIQILATAAQSMRDFPGRGRWANQAQVITGEDVNIFWEDIGPGYRPTYPRTYAAEIPTYLRTYAEIPAPPPPPRAPRCACGDRSNHRWEHHSGGCTYLDPDVDDYEDEGPD